MARRFRDATLIQQGACNPSGVANSIVRACREVHEEKGDTRTDPAIRLMVHQLAFICNVRQLDDELNEYSRLMTECEQKEKENENNS